ncbi:MAG: FMN-binding protein [candidate division KSB1 bacterium]|nr:FMN-binding protein [candidate division KSB1 bacterium]MDZ7335766.1 FMN-binding protein [candidate division KSB1 bacterium]
MNKNLLTLILTTAIVLSSRCFWSSRFKEMKTVRAMPIAAVDLASVQDGAFKGDFSYGGFTYEVAVAVRDHRIETIDILKNRDTRHARRAEGVVPKVISAQTVNVDVVTGATTTSKALLKAIENALKKGTAK